MMILNKVLKKIGWIPLLTGTGIYGIMLLTESRLILQEYHQIKQLLRQEATTVEWVMNHQITSRRKGLELMVDRQEIRGGMIKNEGELNPKNYIQQKETKNLKIDEQEFQVILARSSSLSQNVKSPLSTVILLGGLMIGLSSALTLYFARSSKLKSKQLEEINQKLILQIQKEAATQAVESGLEALTLLVQDKGFDLAILDMQMPQMDGLSLANCIHALPSTQHLPLVLLISVGHFLPQDTASKKLFAASLTKPIKQSQIYNTLAQILSNQPTTIQFFPTSKPQYSPLEETLSLRILLVEDVPVNQMVALKMLQRLGYRADVANNGLEAIDSLQRQPYDMVFMDVQMPELDGLETTRYICKQWPTVSRPWIIAMTAHAMQGDKEECLNAGMDDYISKPIRMTTLIEAFERYKTCKSSPYKPLVSSPKISSVSQDFSVISNNYLSSQIQDKIPNSCLDQETINSLISMAGEDADIILAEVFNSYLEDAPQRLQAIQDAITNQDALMLQKSAHALKSLSVTVGAVYLAELAGELEVKGRTGSLNYVQSLMEQLTQEYENVKVALQQELT